MTPGPVRRLIARIACAIGEHRFVVWVRPADAVAVKHAHLGAWARCERCGLERDWLFAAPGSPGPDDAVLDRVHGVVRPLREVIATARGERPPAAVPSAPRAESPPAAATSVAKASARPIRRDRAGRSSSRSLRPSRARPNDAPDS